MKKILFILTLLCISTFIFGQISQGGIPPSFELMTKNYDVIPIKHLPHVDIEKIKTEEVEKNGTAYNIGKQIPVDYNTSNSGIWQTLPNGSRIWRLHIQADEKARALNTYFSDFYLPKGSRLFIYNKNKTHILGAYTQHNNHQSGRFSTELIRDDNLIIEYHEAPDVNEAVRLQLSNIGYIFRGVKSLKNFDDFGDSDFCEININCSPEGDEWQDEKNASVRVLVSIFGLVSWCSGAMVNNTSQDCTPYMLSAMHCATSFFGTFIDEDEFNDWIFYFNYESPECANPASEGNLASQSVAGASLVAYSDDGGGDSGSDFLLLQLNNSPPEDYNAYYLGWNNENTPSPEGVTIHHPAGDIMKISHYDDPLVSTTWNGVPDTHWDVVWSPTASGHGVTEGGSSGSPIFNPNGELVGTLTGGLASCSNQSAPDQYGKFSYHWESNGTDPQQQLKPWLDPNNTGATSLTGVYAPCVIFAVDVGTSGHTNPQSSSTQCDTSPITPVVVLRNFGDDVLTSVTISYTINGGTPVDFAWTGSLASGESEEVTLAPFTPPTGTWEFESYTNNPNGVTDENTANDATLTTHITIEPLSLPFQEDFEDTAFNPTVNDLTASNPTNDNFAWTRTTDASGYDMGDACAVFDNFEGSQFNNPGGTVDMLFTPIFNFSGQSDVIFAMDVAYARYDDELFDSLSVMVSTDCGSTFETLWTDGAEGLATTPDDEDTFTPADSSEWRTIVLDLAPYQGNSFVNFAIVNHSGWGNRMFVDNINIGTPGCAGAAAVQVDIQTQGGGCSGGTGSITAATSGGTAPYTYQWSNNETTSTIDDLSIGSYTVTVTDANGCLTVSSGSITGTGGGPELSTLLTTSVSCYGETDAFIGVIVMNGTEPYTYQWNHGPTTEDLDDQAPGTYTLQVTDANGCVGIVTVEVAEPDELMLIPSSLPSSGNDGVATVNVAGGTPPYEYLWSDGQTTQSATGLAAGDYSVMVTDINGCTISGSVTVNIFTNTHNLENLTTFDVSPNPSTGQFVINLDFEVFEKMDIFVFNTLGQKIIDRNEAGKSLNIPINMNEQIGTYFVVIQTERGQAVKKVLIIH